MKNIFYVVFLISGLPIYGQTTVRDVYKFPFKQGSKEWTQLESVEKRIAALQIPDSIVTEISTEGLLETCLEFPYLTDIFFCENYQEGFEALIAEFNGFQEFFKRGDLINVLLKKYKNISTDITSLRSKSSVEQGNFSFRCFVLEFMLTQDIVFKKLSSRQEEQLFLLSFEHKQTKSNYSDIFSNLNALPLNLLYAKKIINDPDFKFEDAKQKKAILDFVQAPVSINQQIVDDIEKYIKASYK
ncbi:MAG: hypothetical protein AB2L20_28715 [Mangrovibacterium sp.]